MLSDGTVQYLADNNKVNVFLPPCKNSLPDRSQTKNTAGEQHSLPHPTVTAE